MPLLKAIMRCTVGTKESEFRKKLLTETKKSLESDEVAVVDAGFTIREMLESGIDRFVLREAINCTVRRNEFPKRKEKGRPPEYGDIVRPLSRSYKGKRLEATTPDSSGRFLYSGRLICYQASVDPNLAFLAIFSRDCRDFGVIYSDFGYRKQPISYLKIAQI
ncbi:hypothetical protein KFU94_60495 [Chloroflexi bacterium TSY]|nr:hypothetical protein [Chloroflexi bacterium TSY]